MIGYLEGTVRGRRVDAVLLQTAGGVGYEVHVPLPVLADLPADGSALALHVVTVVRDTEIALYGFDRPEGKRLFALLTKASGVGPKLALAFLSAFRPAELQTAIVQHDVTLLATIPGVGKKTAARLCVELSDRMAAESFGAPGTPAAGAPESDGDLISALTNLGFPEKDVVPVLRQFGGTDLSFADKLKSALNLLTKR
ncbi:MAG: Holliday junction branch migration protein RuvA [Gammaproteobacteria bacterium]|nr:Holliday junction branch migration protein RuvA [Gammaproteobacteria bacterium]